MDAYPGSSDWLDSSEHESFFKKLKYVDCLTQYESSNILNGTLSKQYFP